MSADRFQALPPIRSGEDTSLTREQSLQRIAETAEYVSQRALQLDEQVQEAEQIVLHLSALARQLRTLSSNTTLEATRMRMSGPLAEIARQMRRISQQIGESNDQLALTLRGYTAATGELRQAAGTLVGESKTAQGEDEGSESFPFAAPRPAPLPRTGSAELLRPYRGRVGPSPADGTR